MILRRLIAKFSEHLLYAIDVIVRGVKSGYPFTVALGLVGKEMGDPIGTEFGMTSDEISFGSEIGSALDHLFERVGHADLLYMIMSLKIQMQTGGNLSEILSRLARLLRERAMICQMEAQITSFSVCCPCDAKPARRWKCSRPIFLVRPALWSG